MECYVPLSELYSLRKQKELPLCERPIKSFVRGTALELADRLCSYVLLEPRIVEGRNVYGLQGFSFAYAGHKAITVALSSDLLEEYRKHPQHGHADNWRHLIREIDRWRPWDMTVYVKLIHGTHLDDLCVLKADDRDPEDLSGACV